MFEKFADVQVQNGNISSDDKELIIYGLKEGVIMIGNIITTLLIGVMFSMLWQSIAFIFFYSPLRVFAGGSHSKTHLRCYISSILITIFVLISIKYYPDNYLIVSSIALISGAIILWLAPVEDKNKPLDKLEVTVYKKKARIILAFEIVIISILIAFNLIHIAKCIAVSLFTLSITLVAGKIKNIREEEYKVKN